MTLLHAHDDARDEWVPLQGYLPINDEWTLVTGGDTGPTPEPVLVVSQHAYGSSPIPSSEKLPWSSPRIRLEGVVPTAPEGAPASIGNTLTASVTSPWTVGIRHTGRRLAIHLASRGSASGYSVTVNGEEVVPPTRAAASLTLRLDFGARATRTVRVGLADMRFAGMDIGTGDVAEAPAPRPSLAIFGDSWVEGTSWDGASNNLHLLHMAYLAGQRLGCDTYIHGIGGTGYENGSATERHYGSDTRLAPFEALDPDWMLFFGTINDTNAAAVSARADTLFSRLATSMPATKLLVIGPESYNTASNSNAAWTAVSTALKNAVAAAPNAHLYVDPRAEAWVTGTGTTTAPKGDGTADQYHNGNNTNHLSLAGNAFYGLQKIPQALAPTMGITLT